VVFSLGNHKYSANLLVIIIRSGKKTFLAIVLACTCSMVLGDAAVKAAASAAADTASSSYHSYYASDSAGYAPSTSYGTPGGAPVPSKGYGAPAQPAPAKGYGAPSQTYGPAGGYEGYPPGGYDAYRLDSESPFVKQRLFNTAVALTVPLFSFQLPQRSAPNDGVDLANQV